MSRYTGWRRLSGDTADRPDLLDFGKKLLGYLDGQRRLSGVKTCAIERTMPDGSIVRARFDYEIPVIEVRTVGVPETTEPPEGYEGFIVRPSPNSDQSGNTEKNHVLLTPRGPALEKWQASFFADAPDHYTLPHTTYGTRFPEGIGAFGLVDWRNADESVMVTFHGPQARYFKATTNAGNFSNRVYFKGQRLLDAATLSALTPGIDPCVRGACLRMVKDAGLCLLVCVADFSTDFTLGEYLLRVPVKPTHHPASGKWQEAATLAVDDTRDPEMLGSHASDDTIFDRAHPWMFNQSGTQARCIRYNATQVLECLLSENPNGTWTYSQVPSARPLTTRTSTINQTAVINFGPIAGGTYDIVLTGDGTQVTSAVPSTVNPFDPALAFVAVQNTNVCPITAYSKTLVDEVDMRYLRIAVDFRKDVPVYADVPTVDSTNTWLHTASPEWSETDTTQPLDITFSTNTVSYTTANDVVIDGASHIEQTSTNSSGGVGIRTDWTEVSARSTGSALYVVNGSQNTAFHAEKAWTDGASVGPGSSGHVTGSPNPPDTTYGTGTIAQSFTLNTTTSTKVLAIGALDLRYKLLVYALISQDQDGEADNSVSIDYSTRVPDTGLPTFPARTRPGPTNTTPVQTVGQVAATTLFDHADEWGVRLVATTISDPDLFIVHAAYMPAFDPGIAPFTVDRHTTITTYPESESTSPFAFPTDTSISTFYDSLPLPSTLAFELHATPVDTPVIPTFGDFSDETTSRPAGAWQVYKGAFCYSMARFNVPSVIWESGVGNAKTGKASTTTMTELTGATVDEVRFHPVGILTRTSGRLPR